MNPSHMVEKIPPAGKSISGNRSITTLKEAKVGVISVAMESVGFPFMSEKTRIGRKLQLGIQAGGHLATIWFQVRIQVFAVQVSVRMKDINDRSLTDRRIFVLLGDGYRVFPRWKRDNSISHHFGLARHSKDGPGDFSFQRPWI